MGSQGPTTNNEPIHVLVTGFGPFRDHLINPSFLIANALPSAASTPYLQTIHIHPHPSPVRVSYKTVRQIVPALLFPPSASPKDGSSSPALRKQFSHPSEPANGYDDHSTPVSTTLTKPIFDIVIHIGMAPGRKYFTLERLAHRDWYVKEDVDGETMKGDELWQGAFGAPEVLGTGFDAEDVWRRWKSGLLDEDVRPSDDAGHYLCDFTYYTSLVEYWRRDPTGQRPVVFLHVPGEVQEEDIQRGTKVTLELIRALVESRRVDRIAEDDDMRFS